MSIIQTILGPIDPSDLGITYSHDHILFIPPAPFDAENPEFRLDDLGIMTQEINYFKQAGGKCIVEMTTVEMGRSPSGLEAISKATGIHIIAATGFNKK
jgi:phosphotriesterase-related protein